MDELSSDIEDMFLMNTRERRSNAGNKMKALLEQEVEEMQQRTTHLEEDEIDLLFQEDENDEDFEVPQTSRRASKNGDDFATSNDESNNNEKDDEDLLFSSESEDNADQEEDDEEDEIQRQERLQKKKNRKRNMPKVLKRTATPAETTDVNEPSKKKRSISSQLNPESLLQTERRTSKRSSVVANKLKVYEKLSIAEEKRKIIQERLRKHKEETTQHILTQEDRMKNALETEKFNLLSLNKYKEQELSKKQSRLALQQRQKLKFKPNEVVLETLSTTWEVAPIMELDDKAYWDIELKKREKKKRKYVRKTKKPADLETEKKEKEKEQRKKEENTAAPEQPDINIKPKEEEELSLKNIDEIDGVTITDIDEIPSKETKEISENTESKSITISEEEVCKKKDETKVSEETNDIQITDNELAEGEKAEEIKEDTVGNASSVPDERKETENNDLSDDETKPHIHEINETTTPLNLKKQVTFDINPQINIINTDVNHNIERSAVPDLVSSSVSSLSSDERIPLPIEHHKTEEHDEEDVEEDDEEDDKGEEEELQLIYEGPVQLVAKNFLIKYIIKSDLSFSQDSQRSKFFNYLNSDNHASEDSFEPLVRSKFPDSSYTTEYEKSNERDNAALLPNLDILATFHKFGEYDRKVEKVSKSNEIKNNDLKIITPSPMGIYANNNTVRKHCLINNRSCRYFDPNLGIPYSDLNSYKIIQELQKSSDDGTFKWFGFRNGGIYLRTKERHAKGVPEGF